MAQAELEAANEWATDFESMTQQQWADRVAKASMSECEAVSAKRQAERVAAEKEREAAQVAADAKAQAMRASELRYGTHYLFHL